MLASITPLGERARRRRWGTTFVSYLIGSVAAGGVVFGLVAGAGWVIRPPEGLVGLALGLATATAAEALRLPVPWTRRQVDEGWLDSYRGWVVGLGYGLQLGAGVTTIVSTWALPAALLAVFLMADPTTGAALGGLYGLSRSLPLLAVRSVGRLDELAALHRLLRRAEAPAGAVTVLGLGALAVLVGASRWS